VNDNLSLVGLLLNFIGAVLLVIPRFRSSEAIQAQAGTYYDKNPHLEEALKRDSNFARIGFLLMAAGFLLQIVSRFI
jgi:hypothetical protein